MRVVGEGILVQAVSLGGTREGEVVALFTPLGPGAPASLAEVVMPPSVAVTAGGSARFDGVGSAAAVGACLVLVAPVVVEVEIGGAGTAEFGGEQAAIVSPYETKAHHRRIDFLLECWSRVLSQRGIQIGEDKVSGSSCSIVALWARPRW